MQMNELASLFLAQCARPWRSSVCALPRRSVLFYTEVGCNEHVFYILLKNVKPDFFHGLVIFSSPVRCPQADHQPVLFPPTTAKASQICRSVCVPRMKSWRGKSPQGRRWSIQCLPDSQRA